MLAWIQVTWAGGKASTAQTRLEREMLRGVRILSLSSPDRVPEGLSHQGVFLLVNKVGSKLHLQSHVSLDGLAHSVIRHTEVCSPVLSLDTERRIIS